MPFRIEARYMGEGPRQGAWLPLQQQGFLVKDEVATVEEARTIAKRLRDGHVRFLDPNSDWELRAIDREWKPPEPELGTVGAEE